MTQNSDVLSFENRLKEIMKQINSVIENPKEDNMLPSNTFYLEHGDILCCQRKNGVSRYPYSCDGFNMWVYSSGVIQATEGIFNVFNPVHTEHESSVNFFVGIPQRDGTYFPISILGSGQQLIEPFKTNRYLVYSISAAYYITDTEFATFAIRADVSNEKEMRFSFCCINKTNDDFKITLTSCFDALLKNGQYDDMWERNQKNGEYISKGEFILKRKGFDYHALAIKHKITNAILTNYYYTVSRSDFLIYQNRNICNAESLKLGRFEKQTKRIGNLITPVAAEILHLEIKSNDFARVDYVCRISNECDCENVILNYDIDIDKIDKSIMEKHVSEINRMANFNIEFGELKNSLINKNVLNRFIKNLQKQVDFCAMGDNYVENLLGVRDVFQQLEQALIWDPEQAREKIIRSLGYLDITGRAPRQFSIKKDDDDSPSMDLREYIDQGNWIISTLYTYLAYTNDFSILEENVGYYEIVDESANKIRFLNYRDSVLEHLIKIIDYLDSNIDREEGTNCLRILRGDWNDSIDGLGATDDDKKFGTGVSVMATLHFYQNLSEMSDILTNVNKYPNRVKYYNTLKEKISDGLNKYAVEKNENGEIRLIHGWGDHRSYKVGSFCDPDGLSRISFAPFAFWALSGMVNRDIEMRKVIINGLKQLDSRYGILTNKPAFTPETSGIGRITGFLKGVAENACAYTHASMFSILALYLVGESEYAWNQLEKTMIISQKEPSKSPFVMSNSYCDNQEEGLNGISAIDWYTGTGTVMMKNLVRAVFGIQPTLNGLIIQTPNYMPCNNAKIDVLIKGYHIRLIYNNENSAKRKILVDGQIYESIYDKIMRTEKALIPNELIHEALEIVVID